VEMAAVDVGAAMALIGSLIALGFAVVLTKYVSRRFS
jgi:hypothetical protein